MNDHESFVRALNKFGPPILANDSDCLLWQGNVCSVSGYGRFSQSKYAHRQAYIEEYGEIPEGLTIDHVASRGCKYKHCVNPKHLEAVSNAENVRRYGRGRTHCKRNHEFTEETTYIDPRGRRICKLCRRMHDKNR